MRQLSFALKRAREVRLAHTVGMVPDASALLDIPIFASDGSTTSLRSHLHPGPLVAIFVRHFG